MKDFYTVKPLGNYKLLGTDIVLNTEKTYKAIDAVNQPRWRDRELIFVLETGDLERDVGVLLSKSDVKFVFKEDRTGKDVEVVLH